MTTQIVDLVPGTVIVCTDSGGTGYVAGQALTMKNIATGSYQQSAKFDLGANFAQEYHVVLQNKFGVAPAATGKYMQVWAGFSDSATAGTNNWGNCSGTDAAYTGYSGGTAAQSVQQLDTVGSLWLDANVGPQIGRVGTFSPRSRYVYFVEWNNSGQTTTNASDHYLWLWPVNPRVEAAV